MEAIKKISVVLMVSLLAVKSMIAPILFVKYEFSKDYIIENYCVNKDKPELHCDGKCYLAKQLKAAEEQDGKAAQSEFLSYLFSFQVVLNSSVSLFQEASELLVFRVEKTFFYNNPFYSQTFHFEIFHPPQRQQV